MRKAVRIRKNKLNMLRDLEIYVTGRNLGVKN